MIGMTLISLMPILRLMGTLLTRRYWPGCPRTPGPNGALGVSIQRVGGVVVLFTEEGVAALDGLARVDRWREICVYPSEIEAGAAKETAPSILVVEYHSHSVSGRPLATGTDFSSLKKEDTTMQRERMIIHPPFCVSASRLTGILWLLIWSFVLVGLWGAVCAEAQDAPADRGPIFELHFEEDSLRVVRNELRRTRRAETEAGLGSGHAKVVGRAPGVPPQTRFPFQVVANNQAKKIIWFNADGTTKAQRSIPEGRKALVPNNGAYVLLVNGIGYAFEAGSQSVELLDAQGTRLWEAKLAPDAFLSPTGETVVSLNIEASKDIPFSIWGPQGKLAEYKTVAESARFSADGRLLFAAEYTDQGTNCVSLFDKQGQRLWKRHCRPSAEHPITDVFISKSGRFMGFTYYRNTSWNPASGTPPPPTPRYLKVLDQNGDMLWTRPSNVWDIAFSEEGEFIATLQGIEGGSVYDREIVVANVHTGDVRRKFSIPHPKEKPIRGYTQLSFLQNYSLLLRYYQRTSDGDILAHLQLFDPNGVLSWERTINPETEDWYSAKPAWLQKGPLLGISMGRIFQLFDLKSHNLPEE